MYYTFSSQFNQYLIFDSWTKPGHGAVAVLCLQEEVQAPVEVTQQADSHNELTKDPSSTAPDGSTYSTPEIHHTTALQEDSFIEDPQGAQKRGHRETLYVETF